MAGIISGAVSIVTAWNTCVQAFDVVADVRRYGMEYEITRIKLEVQTRACETHRERFTTLKPSFCPSVGAQRMKFQVKSILL